MSDENIRRKVDEGWKDTVEKEKNAALPEGPPDKASEEIPPASFGMFLLGMRVDSLIALGEVENPVDKTKSCDLARSKYVIDMIGVLQEKTKNNLSKEESELLDSVLYDLRMRFLERSKAK